MPDKQDVHTSTQCSLMGQSQILALPSTEPCVRNVNHTEMVLYRTIVPETAITASTCAGSCGSVMSAC